MKELINLNVIPLVTIRGVSYRQRRDYYDNCGYRNGSNSRFSGESFWFQKASLVRESSSFKESPGVKEALVITESPDVKGWNLNIELGPNTGLCEAEANNSFQNGPKSHPNVQCSYTRLKVWKDITATANIVINNVVIIKCLVGAFYTAHKQVLPSALTWGKSTGGDYTRNTH
jgi:hypothetical protein